MTDEYLQDKLFYPSSESRVVASRCASHMNGSEVRPHAAFPGGQMSSSNNLVLGRNREHTAEGCEEG